MANFVAETAFDTEEFILSGSLGELFEFGDVVTGTDTTFTLSYSDGITTELLTLTGTFANYVDGFPTTGSITDVAFSVNAAALFRFSNVAMSVEQFTGFVQADDIAQLFQTLLSGADQVDGSGANDVLVGYAGNDTLSGGAGSDRMIGGEGDDVYVVDQAGDGVIEAAGEGTDEIRTSVDRGLFGSNVENLTATGTGNIFLGGSEVNNTLTGNLGNNYIVGEGGNDQIDGGAGRDVASFGLPAGTPGTLVLVDGTGADAGKLLVQLVDGGNVQTVARITLSGSGSATIEGMGLGAVWGTDTVENIEELHFLEHTTDGSNATNIVFVNLAVGQFGDFVRGSENSDLIDLAAYAGAVNANGERGDDTISGTQGNNNLHGGLGDDQLHGLGGNDYLDGGAGNDTISGGAGNDYVLGDFGNDTIDGGSNVLDGVNSGRDVVSYRLPVGTIGTIQLVDGIGADAGKLLFQLVNGAAVETFLKVTLTGSGSATVEGVGIGLFFGTDDLINIESVDAFVPKADGSPASNIVGIGLAPNQNGNFVAGSEASDTIDLANYAGAVNANGNRGDDVITGTAANNNLQGGAGNDTLYGEGGNDRLNGGAGSDTLNGGDGDDILIGAFTTGFGLQPGDGADILRGDGGNDIIRGGDGDDLLEGGDGNDNLRGDAGSDTMDGGAGEDFVSYFYTSLTSGITFDARAVGATSTSTIADPFGGTDTLISIEKIGIGGTEFDDIIYGSEHFAPTIGYANSLGGNGGNDQLYGASGRDYLDGGAGNDTLEGRDGNDELVGSAGNDILDGGAGDDVLFAVNSTMFDGVGQATTTFFTFSGSMFNGGEGVDTLSVGGEVDFRGTLWSIEGITFQSAFNVPGAQIQEYAELHLGAANFAALPVNLTLNGVGSLVINLGAGNFDASQWVHVAGSQVEVEVFGDDSSQTMIGSSGNDRFGGGFGSDVFTGGAGADQFEAGDGQHTVLDFTVGEDRVDVTDMNFTSFAQVLPYLSQVGSDVVFSRLFGGVAQTMTLLNVALGDLTADSFVFQDDIEDDTRIGTDLADELFGAFGNDTLEGRGGDDYLFAGDGNDILRGGLGSDRLYAGAGNDFMSESSGDNGPFGDDLYDGGAGNDRVSLFTAFGPGVTVDLRVETAQNTGSMGTDTFVGIEHITSNYGNDTLTGNEAANWFWTFSGTDILSGNGGNDHFTVGQGDKVVDGGTGSDTVEISDEAWVPAYTAAGITVSLALQGAAQATGVGNWTLTSIENLGGSWGADRLTGDAFANILAGAEGNDTLLGGDGDDILAGDGTWVMEDGQDAPEFLANPDWVGGNDVVEGGNGNDTLYGGGGNDTLRGGLGSDQLFGGTGNDFLSEASGDNGPFGNDLYDGGEGSDRVSLFIDRGPGATVDLRITTAQNTGLGSDTFVGIEHITATYNNDTLTGNDAANWFWTFNGTDILAGNGGDDLFTVGLGDKTVDGGAGVDTIEVTDLAFQPLYTADGITVSLALQGAAQATGIGNWTLSNMENLSGSWGTDDFTGDANANLLAGAEGNDTLRGGDGNDTLSGDGTHGLDTNGELAFFDDSTLPLTWAFGNDHLEGGAGNDILNGGRGGDTMIGGVGDDIYMVDQAGGPGLIGDSVIEAAGEGTDEIRTSIHWGLFGTNVENLTATGTGNIFLGGSEVNNTLTGNLGNNYIVGEGGNDQIDGGAGRDVASFGLPAGTPGTLVLVDGTGADAGKLLVQLVDGGNVQTVARITLSGSGSATIEGMGLGAVWGTDTVENIEELHFLEHTTDGSNATNIVFVNLAVGQFGDFVRGSENSDLIDLAAYAGAVNANGERGDDTISGTQGNNNLHGGLGDDQLHGLGGNDYLDGGAGNDTISGGAGNDYVLGDFGNDTIDGGSNVLDGVNSGRDVVSYRLPVGTIGTIQLVDGIGADAGKLLFQLVNGAAVETFLKVTLTGSGSATVEGVGIGLFFGTDDLINIESVDAFVPKADGSPASNIVGIGLAPNQNGNFVAGSEASDTIDLANYAGAVNANGNRGDDVITGTAAVNSLQGGAGNDTLYGEGGNDFLNGQLGNDTLFGGLDNDTLTGGGGSDTLNGGDGNDTLIGAFNPGVGLQPGDGADILRGEGGDDLIRGGDGDDLLEGGDGNDNLRGDAGSDTLDGGVGEDFVSYFYTALGSGITFDARAIGATSTSTIADPLGGTDTLISIEKIGIGGTEFDDIIYGSEHLAPTIGYANQLGGNGGNDQVFGAGGRDRVDGGAGNDTLEGRGGNDDMLGGDGDDLLNGGAGNDILIGGLGNDVIDGGTGADDVATFYLPISNVGSLRAVAGTGADTGKIFIERVNGADVEVLAMVTVTVGGATVQGLGSAASLGTDTITNVDGLLFAVDGTDPVLQPDLHLSVQLAAGIVSDGYIEGSTVFIDANDNGVLDVGEASTVTDASGNFAFASTSSGTVRAVGGINVDTGLPNLLTLTAPDGSSVINPLTSLIQAIVEQGDGTVSAKQAQDQVLASLGLAADLDLANVDIVQAGATDPAALDAQRAAVMIATILVGAGEAAGADGAATAIAAALQNLAGQVSAPDSQVDLTDTATITEMVTAGLPDGTDVSDVVALLEGATATISTAEDIAQIATAQQEAVIALDNTAPGGPLLALDAASDTGPSSTDRITADITPTLRGLAEAGSTVHIYHAAVLIGSTVAGGNGSWQFTLNALDAGAQEFRATATDASGNQSLDTSLSFVIDTVVAPLGTPDLEDASDNGTSSSDGLTNDASPTIVGGDAEPGATIRLLGSDGVTVLGSAIADSAGAWSVTSSPLTQGTHSLTVTQTDLAGNVSAVSGAVVVTIDLATQAPAITSSATTIDETPLLTGTAEAGASIVILNSIGSVIGTALANSTGAWSYGLTTPLNRGANAFGVVVTDQAGNTSSTVLTTITLKGPGIALSGTSGSDSLLGTDGDDTITGLAGDDGLYGDGGNDVLDGGVGNDGLFGGFGDDRIVFDAADNPLYVQGGDGNDVLVIWNAGPQLGFDLNAHSFEAAEIITPDFAGNAWSSITSIYNGNWSLVQQTTLFDDASRLLIQLDPANAAATSQVWSMFDSQGRLASVDTTYDSGARTYINVDEAGTQEWSADWFNFDAQGRLDSEDVIYDDGSHTFINFDQANEHNWAQDWFSYDALGRLDSEDIVFDNGSRTFINIDQDNSQSWLSAWFTYDAQGRLDTQDVNYDDGSRIFYNYDQANTEAFQLTALIYNASGTLAEQVVVWDDGSTSYTSF